MTGLIVTIIVQIVMTGLIVIVQIVMTGLKTKTTTNSATAGIILIYYEI